MAHISIKVECQNTNVDDWARENFLNHWKINIDFLIESVKGPDGQICLV